MKRLVIVSEGNNTGITLINQLTGLLGKYIKIDNKLLSELESLNDSNIDLILYSSSYVKNRSLRYIDSKIPNIVAKRIIDHKNIKEVISIEEGKDVLFINDGYESTKEAIESLLELGLDHIKYHPYYPDCTSYPKLEIAITTAGTIGVAIMGIAGGLGVPLAPVAGAVVGGAYFGDKLSPFSSS